MSKPATLALLRTLQIHRLITRDAALHYRLDWGLYELGSAVAAGRRLTGVARFEIDRLVQATGEAVLLSIIDNASVLYLDRGQPDAALTMTAGNGRRSPLHTTASGKTLLAYQEAGFIEQVLARPLPRVTTRTVTEPRALKAELEKVRQVGFAICHQEQEVGLSSVAVPIIAGASPVKAALAVAGPSQHFTKISLPRFVSELTATASRVAMSLKGEAEQAPVSS